MSFALDAVDTMSQVVSGDMSLGDGLLSLAKGAATTAVGNFTGGLADSWGTSWSQSMGSSFVGSTLAKVSSTAINQAANIAISGFNLQHGWSMDKDVFKQQMLGAAKSMAISTSTAVVSGAINSLSGAKFGEYTTPGQTGTQTGWHFSDSKVLNKLSSTMVSVGQMAGSLSGQVVSAAMGDGFSLNVLNSKDLGLGGNSTGLLQLTIGGKNSGFKIGQGGADISMGAINQFMAGVGELKDRADVRDLYGGDANAVLAQANMMRWSGNASAMAIANQIMSGGVGVGYSDGVNTAMGNLMVLDRNAIKYDADKSGDLTLESQLQLATLGSHEGQHIFDNLTGNVAYSKPVLNGGNINVLRELAAHGTGVNVWENLTGMFGTPQGSDSSKFVDEMSKLVAAKKEGDSTFANYVTGTYVMSGNDLLMRNDNENNDEKLAGMAKDFGIELDKIGWLLSSKEWGFDGLKNPGNVIALAKDPNAAARLIGLLQMGGEALDFNEDLQKFVLTGEISKDIATLLVSKASPGEMKEGKELYKEIIEKAYRRGEFSSDLIFGVRGPQIGPAGERPENPVRMTFEKWGFDIAGFISGLSGDDQGLDRTYSFVKNGVMTSGWTMAPGPAVLASVPGSIIKAYQGSLLVNMEKYKNGQVYCQVFTYETSTNPQGGVSAKWEPVSIYDKLKMIKEKEWGFIWDGYLQIKKKK